MNRVDGRAKHGHDGEMFLDPQELSCSSNLRPSVLVKPLPSRVGSAAIRLAPADPPCQYDSAKRAAEGPRASPPGASPVMIDLASYSATETLRDGRTVEIRALRPTDREGLLTAVMRCNAGTLYHRFFAVKREFSEKEVHFFFDIDFVKHVALVASVSENGRPTIIGSCRYIVVAPGRAEVAFLVVDDYQRKGLGKALMRRLAAIGREAGLAELVAGHCQTNFGSSLAVVASGHEQPLPLFQQLA